MTMSYEEAVAAVTAPGERYETEEVVIDGITQTVFKNLPPSLRELFGTWSLRGDALFLVYEDERLTFGDVAQQVAAAGAALVERYGVQKGDRVAIAMRNLPEWVITFAAATSVGAVSVSLNAWWTGGELEYGIADSGAKLLIVDAERHARLVDHYPNLPALERVIVTRAPDPVETSLESLIGPPKDWDAEPEVPFPMREIAADDDATIFYTSGTTGHPKGALGSHRNLMTNIMSGAFAAARGVLRRGEAMPAPAGKTILTVIPLFHVTACSATLMGAQAAGHTMIFMRKWDPVRAMEIIERERVNLTGGVPTIAWQLIEHPDRHKYDLSSLEAIAYGGAPSAPELVKRIFTEFGALPGNGWGMTETMATVTSHSAEDYLNRPTSAGPPVPVADLKIMDEAGERELPVGEVGELWARGPMIVKGYWQKPEATAGCFIDGWVRTGDLAKLDEEGFLYIVDRAKDMIIRGGENIYSSEVENVLYAHPAVTDCALIGIPHRTLGEEPAAVVHLAPGTHASEAELQAWVRERLAAFKVPVAIRFVTDTLPRNANGKILKKDLGALFADRVAA